MVKVLEHTKEGGVGGVRAHLQVNLSVCVCVRALAKLTWAVILKRKSWASGGL